MFKKKNPHHKPIYGWDLDGRKAAQFLTDVRPFLVVKAAQADLVLTLRGTVGKGSKLLPGVVERRSELFLKLKSLNQRGM